MVLADLGARLTAAVQSLNRKDVVDKEVLDAILKDICTALLQADVSATAVQRLRTNIRTIVDRDSLEQNANKKRVVQRAIFDELCRLVDPGTQPYRPLRGKCNVFMFVGLQGAGKTTTCTKFAHFFQRRGFRTALVCTDTFRAGAFDQLKQNATKAKIPYYGSYTEDDPAKLASEGISKFRRDGFEIIIVDTSGRHKQETALFEEMRQISVAAKPDSYVFVMDGTIGQAAELQAKAFKEAVPIGSIIVTKLDGHAKGGGAISAVAATSSPIIFIGTGEHLEDIQPFNPRSFISKLLGMGDIGGLIESVKDLRLDKSAIFKSIEKGTFTMNDFREQLKMITSLGPLSKVLEMMPGLPSEMRQFGDNEGASMFKRILCTIDSMTAEELANDGSLFVKEPTRIIRIAKGSGATVHSIIEMLIQARMFSEMFKKMGGKNGLLTNMMNMSKAAGGAPGAGGMPNLGALGNLASAFGGGGLPGMGGGGGGAPPALPGLKPGQRPNMKQMQQMQKQMASMQQMMQGLGGGDAGGMGGLGGMLSSLGNMFGGMPGMPDMDPEQLQRQMAQFQGMMKKPPGGGGRPRRR